MTHSKLAWLTDIHLDFLSDAQIAAFGAEVAATGADGVILTGDISVARALGGHLAKLVASWRMPCWFVAGNHDYYGASIAKMREALTQLPSIEPRLRWLPASGVVKLDAENALVGVDGWGDGQLGNAQTTPIVFNDHVRIEELKTETRAELVEVVQQIGRDEAARLRALLGEALAPHRHVYVATHIPPFREATTHQGHVCGDDFLPWMTCHAVGEVLREMAASHPDRRITVLAGHTHDRCELQIADNLAIRVGAAEYGKPAVEALLELA